MLTNRQIKIFKAIVDEFTRTAEPIGSKRLMDLLDFSCSSRVFDTLTIFYA